MKEPTSRSLSDVLGGWSFSVFEAAVHVGEQQVGHVAAEAVAHEDPLDREALEVGGQRVGGDEPPVGAQAVGEVE